MSDTRLIERWLPIGAIGEESIRERRSMTALPPTYYLHVWWARRPLVASRAAVLASLLPADADRGRFLRVLGIHGDPVAAKARIARANRTGERLGAGAYGYPRQLLCHGTGVEVFRELLDADRKAGALTPLREAAYGYLAISLDTLLNYNNRAGRWDSTTGRVRSIFDRHDFAFVWSYAEMAPLVTGVGYDWALDKTAKCIGELVALVRPDAAAGLGGLFEDADTHRPPVTITCKSGDNLDHLADASIDAVIMDPPYYDNVMYAELSDFFYVWLKRTAGHVFPALFRRRLTDKENEAVANPARFQGQPGARALAGRDYQERMASIFAEMRRVLKPNGVMTLMFTHKATGAWDALTTGLMEAEKRGSELRLWDSARRAAAGALGPADGSRGMIDTVHHAAHSGTLNDARELLDEALGAREAAFLTALEAVLEVLPVTRRWTSIDLPGEAAPAGADFAALYDLVRLAYSDRIDEPEQLKLWQDDAAARVA